MRYRVRIYVYMHSWFTLNIFWTYCSNTSITTRLHHKFIPYILLCNVLALFGAWQKSTEIKLLVCFVYIIKSIKIFDSRTVHFLKQFFNIELKNAFSYIILLAAGQIGFRERNRSNCKWTGMLSFYIERHSKCLV